jgi:hypothetical protein
MGFFSGRVTFLRFRVDGPSPGSFSAEYTDRLREFAAGRQRLASADGIEVGWAAGEHILDTDFSLLKNVINDTLSFDLRIDTEKLPTDLLKAYFAIELKALAAGNPSGFASMKQKREAKEAARDRLEDEAKDGRYKRRKCVPILWDAKSNEVLFGATSVTHVDRLCTLFQQTFGFALDPITSGRRMFQLAELYQRTRSVDDSAPSAFVPGVTPEAVSWIPDETSRDFLGNEFLLWLWYNADGESDTVELADKSDATYMIARTLTLECPRGQTGHETITHDGPSKLPEAKRAVQSGKLPRKCGLTLVRHDSQYEFTLHGETLAVGSCKMPNPDEDTKDARAKLEERADQIRHLIETLDLLYDAFGQQRMGKGWAETLPRMQKWLALPEIRRAA